MCCHGGPPKRPPRPSVCPVRPSPPTTDLVRKYRQVDGMGFSSPVVVVVVDGRGVGTLARGDREAGGRAGGVEGGWWMVMVVVETGWGGGRERERERPERRRVNGGFRGQ
jgi:hypothetical protein